MQSECIYVCIIEHKLTYGPLNIWCEWNPRHSDLGENHMKIRSALLLGGAFLVAAMPAWADRIPYPGTAKESQNVASPAKEIDIQGAKLNAPVDAGFLARPASGMLLTANFRAIGTFDVSTSKSPLNLDTFFTTTPDAERSLCRLGSILCVRSLSSFAHDGRESRRARHGNEGVTGGDTTPLPVSAPEPGSLALLLVGLVGIGLLARRRGVVQDA